MIFIIIILNKSMRADLSCFSLIQTVFAMKSKQKTFIRICGLIKINLTIVNIQKADLSNKKVIGKFKDEDCGIPITESIGLRSKNVLKDNNYCKGGKTAKGIKKNY